MVREVAQVGEILAHKPVLVVAEDTGDRGGDMEEAAFEARMASSENRLIFCECIERRRRRGTHQSQTIQEPYSDPRGRECRCGSCRPCRGKSSPAHPSRLCFRDRPVKYTGAHGGMGGGIVYDIGPFLDRIHDCAGLGCQVDLEASASRIAGLRVGRGRGGCR